jgi:arginine repressor
LAILVGPKYLGFQTVKGTAQSIGEILDATGLAPILF